MLPQDFVKQARTPSKALFFAARRDRNEEDSVKSCRLSGWRPLSFVVDERIVTLA